MIDGPPYSIGRLARYPAGPMLFDKLTDGGTVFLDDADRVEETEICDRWAKEFPALDMQAEFCEKGCRRFSRRGT